MEIKIVVTVSNNDAEGPLCSATQDLFLILPDGTFEIPNVKKTVNAMAQDTLLEYMAKEVEANHA